MTAVPEAPKRRWPRHLAAGSALVVVGGLTCAAFWPQLLESSARKKTVSKLKEKFDVVELGCFELERHELRMCELHLEKGSVVLEVEELVIDFEVSWGLEPQVLVSSISSRGGQLAGEFEDILELRPSGSARGEGSRAGARRLELSNAELVLEELDVSVTRGDARLGGQLRARASSPRAPVEVELLEALASNSEAAARAGALRAQLALEKKFPLQVELEDARLEYQELEVKGVQGQVTLEDEALEKARLELHGLTSSDQTWRLGGSVDRKNRSFDVTLGADGIRPSQLPLENLPLDPEKGTFTGELHVVGDTSSLEAGLELALEDVHVVHPKLARDPVVINHIFEAQSSVDLEARELVLERGAVRPLSDRRPFELVASGRALLARDPQAREVELELKLESAPCQELLEEVPSGLVPALEGFKLGGTASLEVRVAAKMSAPDEAIFVGGLERDECHIKQMPKTVADLSGPFSHTVMMRSGQTVRRVLGRGDLYYTPYDRIPPALPAAVISTEDGGFWRHDGFTKSQFQASLRRNLQLGEFRRGGSTITMQMTKNVLLSHEKTVSRKLQELFLTWVVEETLPKQRIMEIYLNVVEFGPGIYGVGDAADHYFGKSPLEMTSLESAFLATLLPRPVERHEMWCRGELTPKHDKYIRKVHKRMKNYSRITEEQYEEGEAEGIVFSRAGFSGEKACIAHGRKVATGAHTQGAVSGLLWGRRR